MKPTRTLPKAVFFGSFFFICLALALEAPFSSAHLDNGFDAQSGPYVFDVGWTPEDPIAGQSTLIAINVLDAGTMQPVNASSVWIRLELKDRIAFAGTLALEKGSASLSYAFDEAGTWTVAMQADDHKATGQIGVTGAAPRNETGAWMAAVFFAVLAVALAVQLWKRQR